MRMLSDKHIELLTTEAQKHYTFNNLQYHNWHHVSHVLDSLSLLMSAESPDAYLPCTVVAALWHDTVYFAGAKNGVNENASAAALKATWIKHAIPDDEVILHKALSMIENTSISCHLSTANLKGNIPLQLLLDADIAALASPYSNFHQNQCNIILENNGDPTSNESHIKCGEFLSKFLTIRPFIYHTQTARNWYESTARENINRYIKEHNHD